VLLVTLAAFVAVLPASSSTTLAREGLLSFTITVNASEVYLARADGSGQRRLTNQPRYPQRWPALSPDGSKIAFATKIGQSWQIHVMNADGTGERDSAIYDEVPFEGFKGYPDWSPDGAWLTFVAEYQSVTDVVVHNPATGETRNVTKSPNSFELRPRWSPDGSRILFSRADSGSGFDLYTIAPDGTALTRLTSRPGWELDGAFSPDGSQIAFIAYPNGVPDVFVMNADGSNIRDVSNTPEIPEIQPAWSTAGLAFRADRGGVAGIYVMNPDGTGLRKFSGATEFATDPDWSGDGSTMVYVSGRHARTALATAESYGGGFKQIPAAGSATDSAWSWDGRRLAFARSTNRARSDIFTMTPGRRGTLNLTRGRGINWGPSWSPDGKRIAFVRFESFGAHVWLMNADGSKQRPLTKAGAWNDDPSWSPDGRRLVYSARRNGNYDLYILDLPSGRERRLTRTADPEFSPTWSPDGSRIAYVAYPPNTSATGIWVLRANGTDPQLVAGGHDTDNRTSPAWSPAGNRIIYVREYFYGHDTDLWLVDLTIGRHQRASVGEWSEDSPSWQPLQ